MNNYIEIETLYFPIVSLRVEIKVKGDLIEKISLYQAKILYKKDNKIHTKLGALAQNFFESYFFKKKTPLFLLPLNWSLVSDFQKKVYKTLISDVPFGKTISYLELAKKIGNPNACRAVGQALSKNPWPIVVPCHRVIGKQNSLGGFSCGIPIKKLLLQHENIF